MDTRTALSQLFAAPLDEFVGARDRLAGELASAGRKDESRAFKKTRRPSPSAWATNQLVRRAGAAVTGYLEASDRLRASQDALLAGHGAPAAYQSGVDELRRATAALTQSTREVLEAAGRRDDRTLVERVISNVRVAALDPARRPALLDGQLVSDLDAGDAALAGLVGSGLGTPAAPASLEPGHPPRPPGAPAATQASRAEARRGDQARQQEDRAQQERARRAKAAAEAEQAKARRREQAREDEATARAAAAREEAQAAAAREARDTAAAALEDAERAMTVARQALREAEARLHTAEQTARRAGDRARAAAHGREKLEQDA